MKLSLFGISFIIFHLRSSPNPSLHPHFHLLLPTNPPTTMSTMCSWVSEANTLARTSPITSTTLWQRLESTPSETTMRSEKEKIFLPCFYKQYEGPEYPSSSSPKTTRLPGGVWMSSWRSWSAENGWTREFFLYSIMLIPAMCASRRVIMDKRLWNMKSVTCWIKTRYSGGGELSLKLLICPGGISTTGKCLILLLLLLLLTQLTSFFFYRGTP